MGSASILATSGFARKRERISPCEHARKFCAGPLDSHGTKLKPTFWNDRNRRIEGEEMQAMHYERRRSKRSVLVMLPREQTVQAL